jgi:hypothetical protein
MKSKVERIRIMPPDKFHNQTWIEINRLNDMRSLRRSGEYYPTNESFKRLRKFTNSMPCDFHFGESMCYAVFWASDL